jgi:transcriptional regulator with XRE-family HTH domain
MNKKLSKAIGANLQKARKNRRYTQEEVAQAVNVSTNYYATLERGVAMASLETYYAIFAVLDVKASAILPDRL